MKKQHSDDADFIKYVASCEQLSKAEATEWNISFIPNRQCPICTEELTLTEDYVYSCTCGAVAPACASTMLPTDCAAHAKCTQCASGVTSREQLPEYLRTLVTDCCAYCGGRIEDCSIYAI